MIRWEPEEKTGHGDGKSSTRFMSYSVFIKEDMKEKIKLHKHTKLTGNFSVTAKLHKFWKGEEG